MGDLTRQYCLTDAESARDGTDWPMVSYTFDDADGLIQLLRRLPEDYLMSFGPSDRDHWRSICDTMIGYSRAVEKNDRMIAWYLGASTSASSSCNCATRDCPGGTYPRWTRSSMVHVVATLWMVMFDQSLPFVRPEREWAEGLYSAIAETLHVELV